MSGGIGEVFQRFIAAFPQGEDEKLFAEQVQIADISAKIPHCTVLVRGRREGLVETLAIILMTLPSASPNDASILEFATRRARAHKAPYFVTWTLREATLWSTPRPGVPVSRDSLEKIRDYPELYDIGPSAEDPLPEPTTLELVARGQDILRDLARLFTDGALQLVQLDATYFVGRLLDAVHHFLPIVSKSLHERLNSDIHLQKELTVWATKQSIAGAATDADFAESIARQIIYRLLGKILFYQSLRRVARQLPKLDLRAIDSAQVLPSIRNAFAEALKIDYHAVFEEDLPDRIQWPSEASRELAAFVDVLNTRDFANLPQDVVGTVFERLIPPEDRHLLGQYFTSEALCDIGIAFCVSTPEAMVADVTCGTGTFLIRAYDRKRWLGNQVHSTLLSQLWGIDIAPFPAELAVINLFRQNLSTTENFPRIACRDFFTIKPGDKLPFPPPKMDMSRPEQINEPIPLFDAIVGNFPYVNADQIGQKDKTYLEFLRNTLIEDWLEAYPNLFYYPNQTDQREFERAIAAGKHKTSDRSRLQHRLSTYADLYVYLFFHTTRFLKVGSRMGVVTSNAWLDVNYGYALQQFLCDQFKIVAILESRCEPWFTEASVNTTFTIIERCQEPNERDNHLVKFVKVKKQLAELIPLDAQIQASDRWQRLRRLTERIETTGRKDAKTVPLGIVTEENESFRIRVCRQSELREELKREQKTAKWGKYLRAPQVFFDLQARGRLCPLVDLADVARGSLSGINEFYHLTPERAHQLDIESEFLKPMLKSPGESTAIPIDKKLLSLRLFVCRLTKKELAKNGKKGALNYIEWGEKQVFQSGKQTGMTWPHGAEVRVRKPGWYAIPEHRSKVAQVFLACAFGDRHMHRFCKTPVIADKRLYVLLPEKGIDDELLAAIMNSSVTALSMEIAGRVTMGDGVLELTVEDARDYLFVPDLRQASASQKKAVATAFEMLCKRNIGSVFEEVKQKDRQALDAAILVAIGLDPKTFLKPMYEGLCELVRERIDLGQMRGKARATKVRGERAEKKTVQEVLEEILPDGPKHFPEEFFSTAAATEPKTEIDLPEEPLVFDNRPMFMAVHVKGNSFSRNVKNPAEGKFLLFAQRAGHKVVGLPDKTVELARTVANYEKYLRELRDELYEAYYRRTLDDRTAARLTQSAFDRFRLPNIEP